MNPIAKLFLRAKHWQMFLLLVGLWVVAMVAVFWVPFPLESPGGRGAGGFVIAGLHLLWMYSFLAWFWFLGTFFNSLVKPDLRPRMRFFRIAIIFPAVYISFFLRVFLSPGPVWMSVILPFHLFAMFCIFYSLYFVSKNMTMAETGRPAIFRDYAAPFMFLWFFPLGVWVIQPKVNQLYADWSAGAVGTQ